VTPRSFAFAAAMLLLTKGVAADGLRLRELEWTGAWPTFPRFRAVTSGDFEGDVEARIATRADPVRYRACLAFYRLAAVLGSRVVPRTEVYPIHVREVLAALSNDSRGLALLRQGMAIHNDGTVAVLVSAAVAGAREVDINASPEAVVWRSWAEGRQPVPPDRRALVGGYVEMLVLDYLTANVGRRRVTVDSAAAGIYLTENGTAWNDRADPRAVNAIFSQLKRVRGFSRRLFDGLRGFDRSKADETLHAGSFATWLVASHPMAAMMERKRALLDLVEARMAEVGEASAVWYP